MTQTRRELLQYAGAFAAFAGGWIDKDGDGEYLDDILGENESADDVLPTFVATDAADAESIDPGDDEYPICVYVLGGRLQGTHIVTEGDIDG